MFAPDVQIKSENGFTKIYIDGHPIEGVRSFSLKQGVGNDMPVLTLDINALNVSIDSRMQVFQEGMSNIKKIVFEGDPE